MCHAEWECKKANASSLFKVKAKVRFQKMFSGTIQH